MGDVMMPKLAANMNMMNPPFELRSQLSIDPKKG